MEAEGCEPLEGAYLQSVTFSLFATLDESTKKISLLENGGL